MNKDKKYLWIFVLLTFVLIGTIIFLLFFWRFFNSDKEWNELKNLLGSKETFVDVKFDKAHAYAIVSREGRTDYGDIIVVFERYKEDEWKRVYDNDFKELKPWKIALVDVDGDTDEEIIIAVKKSTHYDDMEDNRMFIFNYNKNVLVKKWTGSRIAGRWRDFYSGNLLPILGDELIFVEQADDGKEKISIYYWFDFGFLKLAESDDYEPIKELSIIGENQIKITYSKKKTAVLSVKGGKIIQSSSLDGLNSIKQK